MTGRGASKARAKGPAAEPLASASSPLSSRDGSRSSSANWIAYAEWVTRARSSPGALRDWRSGVGVRGAQR